MVTQPRQEAYLLRTRLRKMPYKHIAAHLQKTELACRLHYHQLCHGSNRRRRTASLSSVPALDMCLPLPSNNFMSPAGSTKNAALSPPSSPPNYELATVPHGMQLPSALMGSSAGNLPNLTTSSMTPPPSMHLSQQGRSPISDYMAQSADRHAVLPPVNISLGSTFQQQQQQPRQYSTTSWPTGAPTHNQWHVDLNRLSCVYANHRESFWSFIAQEYGTDMPPAVLEQAWRSGMCCSQAGMPGAGGSPITPVTSPGQDAQDLAHKGQDRTSIPSILEHPGH